MKGTIAVKTYRNAVLALALALGACSASQVQNAQTAVAASVTAVQAACKDALAAATLASATAKGGAANTVSQVSGYIVAGCGTAQAVAALAADSSSLQWLGKNQGALETLAATPAVAPAS